MTCVQRPGFTLIELLVVVGVISLLMAIMLPVIGMVRVSAQRTYCASQQRQIGLAIRVYAADNQGALVPFTSGETADDALGGWVTGRRVTWQRLLATYSEAAYEVGEGSITTVRERKSVQHCPQYIRNDDLPHWGAGYGMRPTHLIGTEVGRRYLHNDLAELGNAYNCSRAVVKFSRVRLPSSTLLIGDSVDYRLNVMEPGGCGSTASFLHQAPHDGGSTCWKPAESNWLAGSPYRHRNANYLYYDGHVEALGHTVAAGLMWAPDGQN